MTPHLAGVLLLILAPLEAGGLGWMYYGQLSGMFARWSEKEASLRDSRR